MLAKIAKANCWDIQQCGKGPDSPDPCPAALETRLDGTHGGINGGRSCWVVDGTPCGPSSAPCDFARKYMTCRDCPAYRQVMMEEVPAFVLFPILLEKLKVH
jgi:hypothetical protein